jgi:hypothetical protein
MTADLVEVGRIEMMMVVLGVWRREKDAVLFVWMDMTVVLYTRCEGGLRRKMGRCIAGWPLQGLRGGERQLHTQK